MLQKLLSAGAEIVTGRIYLDRQHMATCTTVGLELTEQGRLFLETLEDPPPAPKPEPKAKKAQRGPKRKDSTPEAQPDAPTADAPATDEDDDDLSALVQELDQHLGE